jgi:flagellar biosynthesis protein
MPPPNPQQRAVALRYATGDAAPAVVARGNGAVAAEIIRRAHEAGVFVHESRELVGLLMQVDLDAHIPPALYVAIAELLAWVYRVERGIPGAAAALPGAVDAPADKAVAAAADRPAQYLMRQY